MGTLKCVWNIFRGCWQNKNKDNERDNWMNKEQMKIRLFVQLVEENEMQLPMNSRITATLDLF